MTAIKGSDSKILFDEYDFSGDTNSIEIATEVSNQQSTTLGASAQASEPILPGMTITQNGYTGTFANADEVEAELYSRLGSGTSYVAALLQESTAACVSYMLDGTFGQSMTIAAPVDGLMTLNGAWGRGRHGFRGLRIANATVNSTGAIGSPVDFGSAGSNGGVAFLFVQAITGSASSATFDVESASTSGGSYTSEGTFTLSAVGGYKLAMTGTVNRWLRLNCTSLGGATDFTVVCVAGIKNVSY